METQQQDLFTGFFRGDPNGDLARYRDEQPVAPLGLPGGRTGWLLTRHDDVRQALADRRLVKDGLLSPVGYRTPVPAEIFAATARNMLTVDPPDHTRLRRLIQSAFTPRRIEALTGAVTDVADELLNDLATPGRHDLVAEYAFPLPIAVISELVGVAPAERDSFVAAADVVIGGAARMAELPAATTALVEQIRHSVAVKRVKPGPDLLSALITASEDGDRLSEDELVSTVYLLLLAGYDTTANFIGNAVWRLLEDRSRWQALQADPALVPAAIEELLRLESPVQVATHRLAAEDVVYSGQLIPAGATVVISMLSANRDERRFADPDTYDPARTQSSHLAFGHGIHRCLGAPLARLEARIALTALLSRCPELRLAEDFTPQWRPSVLMHALETLPVTTG